MFIIKVIKSAIFVMCLLLFIVLMEDIYSKYKYDYCLLFTGKLLNLSAVYKPNALKTDALCIPLT